MKTARVIKAISGIKHSVSQLMLSTLLTYLFLASSSIATAANLPSQTEPSVFSKAGNIYYIETPSNHTIQITNSGKDFSPLLSPNKEIIAFVRTGNQVIPKECETDTETGHAFEIWTYNLLTKKEQLLVANNFHCKEPEKQIINPTNLLFSPDNKTLYFITSAWTTSGAVHSVKINNAEEHFITPANELKVVYKGGYKGYLIVNQHRYFIGGGSFDWYWLMSPEGKEEGPFGPEITADQMNYVEGS